MLSFHGGLQPEAIENAPCSRAFSCVSLNCAGHGSARPRDNVSKRAEYEPGFATFCPRLHWSALMVHMRPGPLVLERHRARVSSWSISPGRGYPVDEALEDVILEWANSKIAALSPGLTRRHEADDGAFHSWPLIMCILERLEARLMLFVEHMLQ